MMRFEGNKLVALLLSAGMATTFLAACSINTDKLGEGISELGNAFVTETETTVTQAPETSETETTVATETSEAPAETTPVATPTPSATPLPQRVDFSNLTDIPLNDPFAVSTEDFSESSYVDGTEVLLAKFEGTRFVVSRASNETVANSINLIVNGFYNEAAGAYSRVYSKAKAEYDLKGTIESPYNVLVDFQYTTNGRALSVLMVYEISGVEEDKTTVIDFASFDMLSGQYITFNTVCKDPAGLEKALRSGLANSLKVQPKPVETDAVTETEAITETTAAQVVNTPAAEDFDAIYIAPGPATTDAASNSFATIYGIAGGKIYRTVIDMNAYKDFLNRYGASLFIA